MKSEFEKQCEAHAAKVDAVHAAQKGMVPKIKVRLISGWSDMRPGKSYANLDVNAEGICHRDLPKLFEAMPKLLEALKEAFRWTEHDLEHFEEVTPNENMLKNRVDELREAIAMFDRGNSVNP